MKKVILTFALAATLTGLTACGGSNKKSDSKEATDNYETTSSDSETSSSFENTSSSSSESSSESSSASAADVSTGMNVGNVKDLANDAVDQAQQMINDELDKNGGVMGKAAKALYGKAADDLRDEINNADFDDDDD